MQRALVDNFLCCPIDKSYPLLIEGAKYDGTDIISGSLVCSSCGVAYPINAGIPDMRLPNIAESTEVAEAKRLESDARDADADRYDEHFSPLGAYQTQLERNWLRKALHARPGDIILDLGAGTGRLTTEIARPGVTLLALDLSPYSLEVNRAKCAALAGVNLHYIAGDACYLPFRDRSFNKVGSMTMLEHIPSDEERRRSVGEMYRVLQPGGRLALTAYNYSWTKRQRGMREGYHGPDMYYYRFDRAELRSMMGQFKVNTITALLNLPDGIRSVLLDRIISAVPPVADYTGSLLFAQAERPG